MSEKKPTPILDNRGGKICPVCHKRSYSVNGIHPQCAARQADSSRRLKLIAEQKAAAEKASQTPPKEATQEPL